jgi:hypothetical protein
MEPNISSTFLLFIAYDKKMQKLLKYYFYPNSTNPKNLYLGRVRILIKTRLKVKFDIFSIVNLSNFTFNRFLMSIRTRPES